MAEQMEALSTTTEQVEIVRTIDVVTAEVLALNSIELRTAIEIGRRMYEAKEMLPHGEFGKWLKRVGHSASSASGHMQVYKEYGAEQESIFGPELKCQTFGNLSYTKALALLSVPKEEREEFVIANNVEAMSTRELKKAIKERDEARERAEKLERDMTTQLEEQRTVYDVNMADARAKLEEAENRAEGYAMKLEEQKRRAAEDLSKAEDDIATLKDQLNELMSAPKQVAVEKVIDQNAIDAATAAGRKEAEEKLKAKLEKAEKAKAKAEQAKNKAEQDLAALKVAQEDAAAIAEREKQAMAEQVQDLQKKLAVASSSEMTIFKLHFEQGQVSINKMAECIARMEEAGDNEGAAKLKNALSALLKSTLEVLG